jgi:hypothetical protein
VLRNQPRGNQEYDGNDKAPCLEAIDVGAIRIPIPKKRQIAITIILVSIAIIQ